MGKHERGIAEDAEIILALLINGETPSDVQTKHPFFSLLFMTAESIKEEHKNIKKAIPVGNTYDTPGDVMVILQNDQKIYIELKCLRNTGSGTLANISQDAMTLLGIYKCQSWSVFRKEKEHRNQVIEILNRITYPFGKIKQTDSDAKISKAADFLKKVIEAGNNGVETICRDILASGASDTEQKEISNVILDIIAMDKEIRRQYLLLLKKTAINKENLKKFVILLLRGIHTQKDLSNAMDLRYDILEKINSNYEIYYLYKNTGKIKKDSFIKSLINIPAERFDVEIKDGETNLVVFEKNGERHNLIRIVYHWKNKFAGIETPCLNIFKF